MVVLPLFSKIKKAVGYHGLFVEYITETTKKPWRFKEILHGSCSIYFITLAMDKTPPVIVPPPPVIYL